MRNLSNPSGVQYNAQNTETLYAEDWNEAKSKIEVLEAEIGSANSSRLDSLEIDKEAVANKKSGTLETNKTSDVFYPTVKAVYDWAVSVFVLATALANSVRTTVLTGYVVGTNTAVAATDTVLGAIQKIQGQITAVANRVTPLETAVINNQTVAYTIATTDINKVIAINSATAVNVTIPLTLVAGFKCTIIQAGAGQLTFVNGLSQGSRLKTNGQHSVVSLFTRAVGSNQLTGDLVV